MTINLTNPVNWRHPLNRGRSGWWKSLPGRSTGRQFRNIITPYHASFSGTPTWNGWNGANAWGCLGVDAGSNSYAVATIPSFSSAAPFTVGGSGMTTTSATQWIITIEGSGGNTCVGQRSGGAWKVEGFGSNSIPNLTGTTTPASNVWYRVVYVWDGTNSSLYVNGIQEATNTTAPQTYTSSCNIYLGRFSASFDNWTGSVDDLFCSSVAWDASLVKLDYHAWRTGYPGVINRTAVRATIFLPSGTNYTLTSAIGTYTLSGQAATLRNARRIASDLGTYVESGQAATLRNARRIAADNATYTLSGQAATTRVARLLTTAAGGYTLSGQAANLLAARRLTSAAATYTLTGQTANLLRALKVAGAIGAFTLNGQDAALQYSGSNPSLAAGAGGFTLSGQTANLLRGLRLAAATGTITESGQDAGLRRGLRLVIGNGTYTLSGIDADLAKGLGLVAGAGSFAVTGQDVGFLRTRRLTSALGTFTLNGQPSTLTYSGASDLGPLTLTGFDLSLDITFTGFILD